MRFERRHDGLTYAITLRPRADDKRLLRELEVEIYRKHASGDRHGFVWKLLFSEKELKIRRYEDRDDWTGSYRKLLEDVIIKADWLEGEWYLEDIERTIRDLGVDKAVEHILSHLKIVFGHPLSIPLRL